MPSQLELFLCVFYCFCSVGVLWVLWVLIVFVMSCVMSCGVVFGSSQWYALVLVGGGRLVSSPLCSFILFGSYCVVIVLCVMLFVVILISSIRNSIDVNVCVLLVGSVISADVCVMILICSISSVAVGNWSFFS